MGSMLSNAFIPPGSLMGCVETPAAEAGLEPIVECLPPSLESEWLWGMVQCLTLLTIYGYVLFNASNMLADGSELLLLVPSLAGVVGSVVLPILGAVPDGAIMLFSGLGPGAQEQLQVGVGTLAGSTIMLLTVPWGLCILAGSVGIRDGEASYGVKKPRRGTTLGRDAVIAEKMKGDGVGVTPSSTIAGNAKIMLATACIYLIIQGPAFAYSQKESSPELNEEIAEVESDWAMGGLIVAILGFCVYLVLMVQQGDSDVKQDKVELAMKKEIDSGSHTTILGLITPLLERSQEQQGKGGRATLILDAAERKRLSTLLAPFFTKYDADGDGDIGVSELQYLLGDLGSTVTKAEAAEWMKKLDPNNSGSIHSSELVDAILTFVRYKTMNFDVMSGVPTIISAPLDLVRGGSDVITGVAGETGKFFGNVGKLVGISPGPSPERPGKASEAPPSLPVYDADAGADEEEDEECEVPEDLQDMSPDEQQAAIKMRAFGMMGVGTLLVLIFSDPMVEVMSNVGERMSIPPFYISFVLAPLASNASELLASVSYAKKKTQKTITVALAALEGAACMNNTFCLAIFMALIYFKNLAWAFTAETLAILVIQLIVGILATKKTMTTADAYFVLSLFPLSIAFIATLKSFGFD